MKKHLKWILPLVVVVIAVLVVGRWQKSVSTLKPQGPQDFDGKVHFSFQKLPEGIAGKSGEQIVTLEEIEKLAPMRSFANKKRDVLFAIIYKQFVTQNPKPVKNIKISFKKVSLSPSAILNQYGVKEKYETQVQFSAFSEKEGLAKVDGQLILAKNIDFNNFIWGSYQTSLFRFQLSALDKLLKQKTVEAEAKKLAMRIPDYQQKYIYDKLPEKISDADIAAYLQKYNIEDSPRSRGSTRNILLKERKQRGYDYILEKYLMQLPIQVGLPPPQFTLDTKNDWTPSLGKNGGTSLTLFAGTRHPQSEELIKGLISLTKGYQEIQFFYRPFFSAVDSLQVLTSQAHFCVFREKTAQFWDYFQNTLGDFKNETEAQLLAKAQAMGLDQTWLQSCLTNKKYQEVVDYHQQYAQYLGITTEPVLYIGGEVLQGTIPLSDVEKILQRQLSLPTAGMW